MSTEATFDIRTEPEAFLYEVGTESVTVIHRAEGHSFVFALQKNGRQRLAAVPTNVTTPTEPMEALRHLSAAYDIASAAFRKTLGGRHRKIAP